VYGVIHEAGGASHAAGGTRKPLAHAEALQQR
jgi:hypothetical protein